MSVDLFAGLALLTTLFGKIGDSVKNIQGTPKRQLAKDILELIKVFDAVEISASNVVSKLKRFVNEVDNTKRVRQIKDIERAIDTLKDKCKVYIKWLRYRTDWIRALFVFSPEAKRALDVLGIWDRPSEETFDWLPEDIYSHYGDPVIVLLDRLQLEVQTVQHPSENLLLGKERIETIISQLESFLIEVQRAKSLMRKFASTNLTVEDMF